MSKGDRSVTLDVVKNSLSGWTPKLTRRLNKLAMLMQALLQGQWMGHLKNYRQAQARPHQAFRRLAHLVGHQLSTWTVLHQLTTCESDRESYEQRCGAQKRKCGAVYLREKRSNADTWTKKHCWTDAPTESQRTAHEITHPPPACCETCILGSGIEAPHFRLTRLERAERPIIAMVFPVRQARADGRRADDDLGTFSGDCRLEHWSRASDSIRDERSHRLPKGLLPHPPCAKSDPAWCNGAVTAREVGGEKGQPPPKTGWCFVEANLSPDFYQLDVTERMLSLGSFAARHWSSIARRACLVVRMPHATARCKLSLRCLPKPW